MVKEKISVIIPVFNSSTVLIKALESVITQDYPNIELIVIDGGSTDETLEIIKDHQNNISYWVSEKDHGVYDAMNKGVTAASGTWFYFLGADDRLLPGILSDIFKSSSFTNEDMLYGNVQIDHKEKRIGGKTDYENLISKNIPHQGIFYKKSIFLKFKVYNDRYKILADYDLNLKVFEDESLKKHYLDKTIATFSTKGLSQRTIDYNFFNDKKKYFINQQKISKYDKDIAQYFFFLGLALLIKKKFNPGLSNVVHGIVYSRRRLFYLLITVDYVLSIMGIRKRYKTAEA